MEAAKARLVEYLSRILRFAIHTYQRDYSWTRRECLKPKLWNDTMWPRRKDSNSPRFLGVIVFVEANPHHAARLSRPLVIEGQQCMTPVTIQMQTNSSGGEK